MNILISLVSLLSAIYFLWFGVKLLNIPGPNWKEFREFEGNGRGMIVTKDGEVKVTKFKTHLDYMRFIDGFRVMDFEV